MKEKTTARPLLAALVASLVLAGCARYSGVVREMQQNEDAAIAAAQEENNE